MKPRRSLAFSFLVVFLASQVVALGVDASAAPRVMTIDMSGPTSFHEHLIQMFTGRKVHFVDANENGNAVDLFIHDLMRGCDLSSRLKDWRNQVVQSRETQS